MPKDAKGHGSNKRDGAIHTHRGFDVSPAKGGGYSVTSPTGKKVATHPTMSDAKSAVRDYAKGYERAKAQEAKRKGVSTAVSAPERKSVTGDSLKPRARFDNSSSTRSRGDTFKPKGR